MAYANLTGIACADKTEFFCRMRDFICKRNGTYDYSATGIGWTLHDSSYGVDEDNPAANDWYVIYSAGENSDEDLYFRIFWTATNIYINGYQAWNATAHTGGNRYVTSTTNWNVADADTPTLYVYGDMDSLACLKWLAAGTDLRVITFGKADKPFEALDDEVANCSSTLTAGADVSITVDAVPAGWAVDREIFIRTTHNNATATVKIEKTTIKTLVGLTITADLSNNYTADSKLSDHIGYFCQNTYGIGVTNLLIDPNGTVGTSATTIAANTYIVSLI